MILMAASDDGTESEDENMKKTLDSEWNIRGLKREIERLTSRCHKKIGKASERLRIAKIQVEELSTDPKATLEQLEACPNNIQDLTSDLDHWKQRFSELNQLSELLKDIKGGDKVLLPEPVAELAIRLEVKDEPPQRRDQKRKKKKGPRKVPPRLPYWKYYTQDGTEIRVGKRAQDNDALSTSPEHRDSTDWWMHASGCPGSHIVIRNGDSNLNENIIMDAAALAARQSKCTGAVIKVSMTRCCDVIKPPGAKPGVYELTGNVQTITVKMKEAEKRLARLDDTMQLN